MPLLDDDIEFFDEGRAVLLAVESPGPAAPSRECPGVARRPREGGGGGLGDEAALLLRPMTSVSGKVQQGGRRRGV